MISKKKHRQFIDNVCDTAGWHERKKISMTISAENEEKAWVLANMIPSQWSNISRVIDRALTEFFEDEEIKEQLEEGYERWKKM